MCLRASETSTQDSPNTDRDAVLEPTPPRLLGPLLQEAWTSGPAGPRGGQCQQSCWVSSENPRRYLIKTHTLILTAPHAACSCNSRLWTFKVTPLSLHTVAVWDKLFLTVLRLRIISSLTKPVATATYFICLGLEVQSRMVWRSLQGSVAMTKSHNSAGAPLPAVCWEKGSCWAG